VPDACFIFLDRVIEFDHATQSVFALSTGNDVEWGDIVQRVISAVLSNASTAPRSESGGDADSASNEINLRFDMRFTQAEYEHLIASCLDEIRAGNAYQLCLTNRISVAFESAPSPFDVYERLRLANPSHHGGLIVAGGVSLISSSPEVFLSVTSDGRATTKPIKGTRPRSADGAVDAALADELRTNDKERAENLMIVDLMRNDLGRVCEVGSVTVEKLFDVESYASVHQLVSTVGGNLAAGVTAVDALAACFPAGSMTGAPKLSAMRILNGLEVGPRGIYSGAFGYLSLDGACDFAMVIRSIVLNGTRGYIGTGGGITSGSVPRDEWEETLVKARPLLTALGADLAGTPFELPGANSRGAN
jgi:anthranilate synthase component 1